jgi:DNA-binding GntR family transcriptional regulator
MEAEQIYPVLWSLEQLAVKSHNYASERLVKRLTSLNDQLATSIGNPRKALAIDRSWHEALAEGCGNQLLIECLTSVREKANRYEYAYMQSRELLPYSVEQHNTMIEAIRAGRWSDLVNTLENHWKLSLEFICGWLGADDSE